jgi:F0F1-type ATP synthase assembly protein I
VRKPETADSSRLLSTVFLAQIVVATIVGVVLSVAMDAVMEPALANLIFVVFLSISVSEVIMARHVVRQQLARDEEGARLQASVLASAFSGAIAVYGVVIGILSGHWYFVVPFGVIGFLAWQYLHRLVEGSEDNSDSFRFRSDP